MERILLSTLLCVPLAAIGQPCTWTPYSLNSPSQVVWMDGVLQPDGGMVAAVRTDDGTGDMLILHVGSNGALLWNQRISTTNNGVFLYPSQVLATADGGFVVFGDRTSYNHNQFAVKMNALGQEQWARIYMQSYGPAMDLTWTSSIEELSNGDFMMTLSLSNGVNAVRLDPNGVPLSVQRYSGTQIESYDNTVGDFLVETDGDMLFSGEVNYLPFLVHTNDAGVSDWAYHYDLGGGVVSRIVQATNGDYLIGGYGPLSITRIDAAGVFLWKQEYDLFGDDVDLAELSTGDLLLTMRGDSSMIIQTNSNGIPLAAWRSVDDLVKLDLVGVRNDSIRLAVTVDNGIERYPALLVSQDATSLGCGFTATNLPTPTAGTGVDVSDSLIVSTDSVRTWTMSLSHLDYGSLDPQCILFSGPARPGFTFDYYGQVSNLSALTTGPIDASLTFDPQLTFLSADPAPTTTLSGQVSWSGLPALASMATQPIHVQLQVPPIPGLIGTVVSATLAFTQDSLDASLSNNSYTHALTISGAYDPNAKEVLPRDVYVLGTDSVLAYSIFFQNTGTDTAFNVVVRDTLPAEVSTRSFRQGPSSHPCATTITAEGVLEFTFTNILLPDSNTNEPMSHGFVGFTIDPDAGQAPGTTISNAADIYFDFNPPVRTNDAVVVLTTSTYVPGERSSAPLTYPVPSASEVHVDLPRGFMARAWIIATPDGRSVVAREVFGSTGRLDVPVEDLPSGAYVLMIRATDGRSSTVRFVRE